MQISVAQVNAFTANHKGGNAAGVVLAADNLSEEQMLRVAQQAGFSETAFVSLSSVATRNIRFFTPTGEVDLCGHATIASWSYMFEQGLIQKGDHTQETRAGILGIEVSGDGQVYMEQTKAGFFEGVDIGDIAKILKIDSSDFHVSLKPQIVSTGLRDLLVPVVDEAALNRINPDFEAMSEISRRYDIVGLHVFAPLSGGPSLAVARNFAPLYGINEESATGTSNGALLCYLREHGALSAQAEYKIEQGKKMNQLSYIYGKFIDDLVWIGGTANFVQKLEFKA